ncbi:hypothetical protein NDU88_005031 [Pleurodeles waltl]|uniref:Uncharacterized protein n=1 Tax=Pleurodeles waltl TaxID=8319 RepID=A0AAV7M9D0_PLEWA|nr:hypothetical protein NDU88_005031 [Pleurodeles waltl]
MRPHSRRGHLEIPAGPAGRNLVSTRQPSGDPACNTGAGSKWSRRCCGRATGAVAPVALFTVCLADSEKLHGALSGGPCTAHASGMGSAGAPRLPLPPAFSWQFKPSGKGWWWGTLNPLGSAALVD